MCYPEFTLPQFRNPSHRSPLPTLVRSSKLRCHRDQKEKTDTSLKTLSARIACYIRPYALSVSGSKLRNSILWLSHTDPVENTSWRTYSPIHVLSPLVACPRYSSMTASNGTDTNCQCTELFGIAMRPSTRTSKIKTNLSAT